MTTVAGLETTLTRYDFLFPNKQCFGPRNMYIYVLEHYCSFTFLSHLLLLSEARAKLVDF